MIITALCVKTNSVFTLFKDYDMSLVGDRAHILTDTGQMWTLYDEGDGYYGCTDIDSKHVSFLVE